jgi:hypothetical protein
MRRYARSFWTAGLVVLGAALAHAQAPEVRTWTSGGFKVQAKFVSVADGKVALEQPDGETLEIELTKLSAADQSYVAQQQKASANPFKKKADSPFRSKKASTESAEASAADAGPTATAGRLVKPSWSGVQTILATPANTGWNVPVGSPAPPASNAKLRPAPIPPKGGFFEGSKGVAINASGMRAVVGYAGANPGMNQKGNTRVALCDLENGKLLGSAGLAGLFAPLALSDDGAKILMKTDVFGPGGHDRLEFWSPGKSGIVKGDQWIPYEAAQGSNGGDRDVRWAAFLDPKRLATISEAGNLVIWQIQPLKPLATFPVQSGCTPALSPDRKLLAFATSKDIGVLDVESLEVVAVQPAPMPNMAWTSFAFSPSGKRLACKVFVSKVYVYDVAGGSLYREVSLQGINAQQTAPVFPDDDHLIVGEHTLIDLESQVRLWQYNGNERVVVAPNGTCWFEVAANQNQAGALIPAKVPPPGAQEALARASRDPNFFIFKQGATVAIDVNGLPDPAQRASVTQSLTANLAKVGVLVAASSPVTVQASLEQGKEQEIAYRTIGAGFQRERFKVRPWTSRLKIVYEGKTAWESSASSMPHFEMARLKKDESLQDHVRKFEQPNYAYFGTAELPKLVTRPTGQGAGTLGVSQVTLSGIR